MASLRRTLFVGLVATKINKVIYTIDTYTTGIVQCRGTHFCGSPAILRGNILVPYLTKYHLTVKTGKGGDE